MVIAILVAPLVCADFDMDNARAFTILEALIASNSQVEVIINAQEVTGNR